MRNSIFLVIGLATALLSTNVLQGQNSSTNLDLETINSIGLSIDATVTVSEGSRQKITIEGPANLIEDIKTDVRDGSWNIKYDSYEHQRTNDHIDIDIQVKSLKGLAVSGKGKIVSKGRFSEVRKRSIAVSGTGTIIFKGDSEDVNIALSGVGHIDVDCHADQIHAALSGSGDIALSGSADFVKMAASGSGSMGGSDLKTKRCKATISGSTILTAEVTDDLSIVVSGSGVFKYRGNPSIHKKGQSKSAVQKI